MHAKYDFDPEEWREFGAGHFHRAQTRRGDIRHIVLEVLQDKPMHGYEIMKRLEDKSHGMWRPSPGSIYPTLQLLEEQDLIKSQEKAGKKVYALTEAGKTHVRSHASRAPWEVKQWSPERIVELRGLGVHIMKTMKQILKHGSDDQFGQAKTVLSRTARELSDIVKENIKTDENKESIS